MRYTINADGGARGNPGPAGAGAIIRDERGETVAAISEFLGRQTNNFAEYEAVILALEALARIAPHEARASIAVDVSMDSELVVKQMNGLYKVRHPALREQYARAKEATRAFGSVTFRHVRREQNADADALANRAMDNGTGRHASGA